MPRQRKLPAGMVLRGKVYYACFKSRGLFVRQRLSSDLDAAKAMLNDLRVKADKGELGRADDRYPWAKLRAEFLRWAKQAVRHPEDYERDLDLFEHHAPINTVAELTQERVLEYRAWRLDQNKSPRTVNREVGTLKNMLNRGVEWGRILDNPIAKLEPLHNDTPAKQRRPLTHAEVVSLFAASPEHLKPVWRMFACTGLRRRELVALTFDDIDFRRRTVTVRAATAKSRKAREIPLDDEMLATIERLRDEAAKREPMAGNTPTMTTRQAAAFSKRHVFVTKANTPWRNNLLTRFYAICKRADIEGAERGGDVDIHSLRVTFTTLALDGGAAPKAVQEILGHSTLALTMSVYAKATESGKRAAVSALPFANASPPEHLIPVQKVPKEYPSKSAKRQVKAK